MYAQNNNKTGVRDRWVVDWYKIFASRVELQMTFFPTHCISWLYCWFQKRYIVSIYKVNKNYIIRKNWHSLYSKFIFIKPMKIFGILPKTIWLYIVWFAIFIAYYWLCTVLRNLKCGYFCRCDNWISSKLNPFRTILSGRCSFHYWVVFFSLLLFCHLHF